MDNSIELLEEWQERLFLNAWRIIIRPKCKPDEMPDCWGRTEWEEVNKTARIDIVDPDCLTDKMIPFDFEEVLVHELLHLKFCLLSDNSDENMESRYVHQLIDEMARSLVDAKRCCVGEERSEHGKTAD
jgi:hypothetical protein